jgi:rhamnose transport system permease protein
VTYVRFGRRLYAIGSNPEAARIAGLPAQRTLLTAYVLCGALAGLAGFLFLARFGTITVVAAQGMELEVVAAVVVGGVNIFGGSGTIVGALLGTIMINTLEQSLIRWLQISEFWRDAVLGLLILLAVATDAVIIERLRRLWARSELQLRPEPGSAQPVIE